MIRATNRALVVFVSGAILAVSGFARSAALVPVHYDRDRIERVLETLGRSKETVTGLTRSSDGSQIRVELDDEFLVIDAHGTVRWVRKPSRAAWLDDSAAVVAWSKERALYVGGTEIHLPEGQTAECDQSGRFVVLTDRREGVRTEIRAVGEPMKTLLTLEGPGTVFGQGRRLAMVSSGAEHRSLRITRIALRDDGSLTIEGASDLARGRGAFSPYYALDVDLAGEVLVEIDTVDPPFSFLTSINAVDLGSGDRFRVARSGWVLLTTGDLLGRPLTLRSPTPVGTE